MGGGIPAVLLTILGLLIAVPFGVVIVIYLIVPFFRAVGWVIRQAFRFIKGEIQDTFRLLGAALLTVVLSPMVVGSVVIGRWSASAHYGRAIKGELSTAGACLYRILIGHPARLLCLSAVLEGVERRLPEVVAAAPGPDKPKAARAGQFEGYRIVGSLTAGGSGGRLYVAEPDPLKLAALARQGHADVSQVVIKSFSLKDGSSLPQIVRESRALDAAKRLGLILEHDLTEENFHYVMRYVPGESLSLVTQRLHAMSGGDGLSRSALKEGLGYCADLLRTLDAYHNGGLWHKDVKPDNIIVDGNRAHLVDLGLVTPLRSAMTLTTHGTEYFRDPEMVRLALKGVRVHEVDGAKFDIYAAGAVLYSIVENSFPAHGGLSQVSRPCPEALKWVIRRAMTDYDRRYASAAQMLADVHAVLASEDPMAMRPAQLPSMGGAVEDAPREAPEPFAVHAAHHVGAHAAPSAAPEPGSRVVQVDVAKAVREAFQSVGAAFGAAAVGVGAAPAKAERVSPKLHVRNWWTGAYQREGGQAARPPIITPYTPAAARTPEVPGASVVASAKRRAPRAGAGHPLGRSAKEQRERARARAQTARQRARARMANRYTPDRGAFKAGPNTGVAVALLTFGLGAAALVGVLLVGGFSLRSIRATPSGAFAVAIPDGERPINPEAGSAQITYNDQVIEPAARTGLPQSGISLVGARILVLRDPIAFAPGVASSVAAQLNQLSSEGAELIGADTAINPDNPEADPQALEVTRQLASLRRKAGTAPWRSAGAKAAIQEWLDESPEIGLVVWISRNPANDEEALAWIVASRAEEQNPTGLLDQVVSLMCPD